jgi:hypothetical protein
VLGIVGLVGTAATGVRLLVPGTFGFSASVWFVTGIVVITLSLAAIPAAVTGVLALVQRRPGRGLAIAGLVLCALCSVLWVVSIAWFIALTPI